MKKTTPDTLAKALGLAHPPELVTESVAASLLGLQVSALQAWRLRKMYELPYVKIGRSVQYRLSDVAEFINTRSVGGEQV